MKIVLSAIHTLAPGDIKWNSVLILSNRKFLKYDLTRKQERMKNNILI